MQTKSIYKKAATPAARSATSPPPTLTFSAPFAAVAEADEELVPVEDPNVAVASSDVVLAADVDEAFAVPRVVVVP